MWASKSAMSSVGSGYIELDAKDPTDSQRIRAYLRYRELDGDPIEYYEELLKRRRGETVNGE
jgi:hypothetical protein